MNPKYETKMALINRVIEELKSLKEYAVIEPKDKEKPYHLAKEGIAIKIGEHYDDPNEPTFGEIRVRNYLIRGLFDHMKSNKEVCIGIMEDMGGLYLIKEFDETFTKEEAITNSHHQILFGEYELYMIHS